MESGWDIGFRLDRRWHRLRGEMETSKKPSLVALAQVLGAHRVDYAVIGGLAVQLHVEEPRTTLDIDIAVTNLRSLPRGALAEAGFAPTGEFPHSENWMGPGNTPVQFTDDLPLAEAAMRAETREIEGEPVRVIRVEDLLHAKLRAASDPARRKSKRLRDLADAQGIVELRPALAAELSADERNLLDGPA